MRELIVNADDYGMTLGVSAGIRLAAQGVVRSTTAMANLLGEEDSLALAEAGLSCGLHMNLSYGTPLSRDYPHELLRADGRFDKAKALQAQTWDDPRLAAAAAAEWRLQLARLRSHGIEPTHIDSHHHSHMLPGLWPLALELAREQQLGIRSREAGRGDARALGLFTPDHFIEGYFGNNMISRGALFALLEEAGRRLPQGAVVELMCHPGLADEVLRRDSTYCEEREAELSVLAAADLETELREQGWQLRDYRQR